METLPDYLAEDLDIVSIGSNPSPYSIRVQCYYGNPQNRFWKALNASGLVDEPLQPGAVALQRLLGTYRFGFTDVVKPPTAGVAQLRASDYRHGAPLLKEKLLRYQPRICWFHGKVAYKNYLKYTGEKVDGIDWGLQPLRIGKSRVMVTPNPSPANARYSLDDLVAWYKKVRVLRDQLNKKPSGSRHEEGPQ
ncbi:mismatch-specific DNA-glycosylase [Sulfuriflexus mobilis]|uniref:mismatch-specific DNA-glycosylase n=1 Tax=Sulfuriflexus mobilis TaxID=1811807 RepID=UPI001558557A|nr:mismatch-specific DNA-glycosylase [Sulfuriflexus mobilis]